MHTHLYCINPSCLDCEPWRPLATLQSLANIFTRSQFLQRTLGTRVAAGYLRNRSVSIETALYLLTRKGN